jgi:uncharacterized repeat protein (TIGR02543 family)
VYVSPSGGGGVEIDQTVPSSYPAASKFASGESVGLQAVPAPGYSFDYWSGDLSGTSNPTTITIDCNRNVTARFSQIEHNLVVQVHGAGSTTPTGGQSYLYGATVDITATPDSGWQFESWTGDVADPHSLTTIVFMDSDKTVVANFSQVKRTWFLPGGVAAAVVVIGVITWLALRTRTA